MPETMVFFLDRGAPGTREKLQGLIADGWVQDKSFNQGKAIELSSHVAQDLEVLAPVLVYHLMRFTPEEVLAQAKKDEKAPITDFENVPAEKVNDYIKNGWEFMDEKNMVWQKNAHLVKRAKKDPDVVDGVRIRNPKATKEDPCFGCPDKNNPEHFCGRPLKTCRVEDQEPAKTEGSETQKAPKELFVTSETGDSGPVVLVEVAPPAVTRENVELPFAVDDEGKVDLGDGIKVDAKLAKLTLYPGKELTDEEKAFKERHPKAFEIMQKRIDALRKQKSPELFSPNAGTQSEDRKA